MRLAPARPPERRARAGQLGVAVVLVALGVLGAYWFSARGDAKVQVAVLARDIRRGETITAADVASVGMSVDNPVDAVRVELVDTVLAGRLATADLAKGTVLTRAMVSDGTAPAPGKAVVGLNLSPGEYPVDGMTPGVAVAVVRAPKTGPGEVLVERAEVYAVAPPRDRVRVERRVRLAHRRPDRGGGGVGRRVGGRGPFGGGPVKVAFGSLARAPGATTTLLAAAAVWPGPELVVVEADADGGVLAARFGLSLHPEAPTLMSLLAATRHDVTPDALTGHAQRLPGGIPVVCGPSTAEVAAAAAGAAG